MRAPEELFVDNREPFEPNLDDQTLSAVEKALGVRLPQAYVDLCRTHNGGLLRMTTHAAPTRTTWASDHVAIYSILAIGQTSPESLCGERGSRFWVDGWGYPEIGVYFADCPSAGHDMLALDYREGGDPAVVHVDQEWEYRVTRIASSFEAFINGLQNEDAFEA